MVSYILYILRGGIPRSEYRAPCFQCGNFIIDHDIATKARGHISSSHFRPHLQTLLLLAVMHLSIISLPVSSEADKPLLSLRTPSSVAFSSSRLSFTQSPILPLPSLRLLYRLQTFLLLHPPMHRPLRSSHLTHLLLLPRRWTPKLQQRPSVLLQRKPLRRSGLLLVANLRKNELQQKRQ